MRHSNEDSDRDSFSSGNPPSNVERLPADTVKKVLAYLKFDEICRVGGVCSYWYRCASLGFFRKLVRKRWPTEPRDFGMGIGSPFTIPSRDWRPRLIVRQHILDAAAKTWSLSAKIGFISMEVLRKGYDTQRARHYTLEAARVFSTIFDIHYQRGDATLRDRGSRFNTPDVSPQLLANVVATGQANLDNRATQLLMCKSIGILSICEQNRKQASRLGFVHYLVNVISGYKQDSQVVGNALWALVIVVRPEGGVEGEVYSKIGEENFRNVIQFGMLRGVELLFSVIDEHSNNPRLLSKAFWLTVNLSLMDHIKMKLIQRMSAIGVIKCAMQRFPDHEELQYRTCFALINIAVKREAKRQIRELGLIPLVVRAARKFPNSVRIQKTFCNVTKSIISRDIMSSLVLDLRAAGIAEMLQVIKEKFAEHGHLVALAENTRSYLEML